MTTMEQAVREPRTTLAGTLRYSYGSPEDSGVARWCDVSRAGASITLGRYLRPGREIQLQFESPLATGGPLKARARVVWCTTGSGAGQYRAGLLIYRDTPEMALDFAALGYAARSGNTGASSTGYDKPVWTLFPLRKEQATYSGLAQARAV